MNSSISLRQKLTKTINELPTEVLPELVNFVEYLRFKVNFPQIQHIKPQIPSDLPFLQAIAGIGASDEDDISERDEEILAKEIHPIYGWSLKRDNSQ
jgi:hypothetical protein